MKWIIKVNMQTNFVNWSEIKPNRNVAYTKLKRN